MKPQINLGGHRKARPGGGHFPSKHLIRIYSDMLFLAITGGLSKCYLNVSTSGVCDNGKVYIPIIIANYFNNDTYLNIRMIECCTSFLALIYTKNTLFTTNPVLFCVVYCNNSILEFPICAMLKLLTGGIQCN